MTPHEFMTMLDQSGFSYTVTLTRVGNLPHTDAPVISHTEKWVMLEGNLFVNMEFVSEVHVDVS